MIDYLAGIVKDVKEKSITLLVDKIGFDVHVPNPSQCILESHVALYTYLHWNQENGPSVFGFTTPQERTVFLLIIECPKIGPSIALNILSHMSAGKFLDALCAQNEKALSAINGIGAKKAEQIIVQLKHKASKLIETGKITREENLDSVAWNNLSDVLVSLNYSKPEIGKAMQHLTTKYAGQNTPLDQLIRAALAFLSAHKA